MDYPVSRLLQRQPSALLWLSATTTLAALPHLLRVPIWIALFFVLLLFWRLSHPVRESNTHILVSLIGKSALAIIILGGVFASYGTLMGRDAGVALLILLSVMKLLEIRSERDYYITIYIGMLLILTNFLYTQTLPTAFYTVITLLVFLATLAGFNDRNHRLTVERRLRLAGGLLLQALPLVLILFLFFPRASGPLWGLPEDARGGVSGLDDEMTPGSLSRLSLSDEVAFRVEFDGAIPDRDKLYWRGPVLWYTDGFKWVPDRMRDPSVRMDVAGDPVSYTVILEPTRKKWLFALEMPAGKPDDTFFTHDVQIRRRDEIQKRIRYEMDSHLDYRLISDSEENLERALQLPRNYHDQAIELGRRWREEAGTDNDVVQKALTYFREQEFHYTLTPQQLINDPVDEFLFQTRQGFCEHYTAAFIVLMRAAGIPARAVMGYQGGRVNPMGDYLIVRQRDAHAWAEVWLGDERGWVRVDPTAAVSPTRVDTGIDEALPESVVDVPLVLRNNSLAREVWRQLGNTWDAINNRWNQWVLGYDRTRQSRFLDNIGLKNADYGDLILILTAAVVLFFIIMAFRLFRISRREIDAAKHWYRKFQQRLARCGIRPGSYEGPRDYAARAARHRHDLAEDIQSITDNYVAVRYAGKQDSLERLKRLVKQFRPAKQ